MVRKNRWYRVRIVERDGPQYTLKLLGKNRQEIGERARRESVNGEVLDIQCLGSETV